MARHQSPHRELQLRQHSDDEWTKLFPYIHQLYIEERRPLRQVAHEIELKHGFKATERMYKIRLRRWKLFKYMTRKRLEHSQCPNNLKLSYGCGTSVCPSCGQRVEPTSPVDAQPVLASLEQATLSTLQSIRGWADANFEPRQDFTSAVPFFHILDCSKGSPQVFYSFALASSLFARGAGHLAGKAVRKGFLAAERAIQLMDMKSLWGLIDVMYDMAQCGQVQILRLFLTHVTELSVSLLSRDHPVSKALEQLALLPEDTRANIIQEAWQCNTISLQRLLCPWSKVIEDHLKPRTSFSKKTHGNDHRTPSDSVIIQRLVRIIQELDLIKPSPFSDESMVPHARHITFRETSIKNSAVTVLVDVVTFLQLAGEDLQAPFSPREAASTRYAQQLGLYARILAEEGRHSQLARSPLDTAEDMVRDSLQILDLTQPSNDLSWLQQMCALEDILDVAGKTDKARSVGEQMLQRADAYLADIPDQTS